MITRCSGLLLLCSALISLLSPRCAQAIPAFARREGLSCQVCHFRVPELNEFGLAYQRRGLRLENSSSTPATPATTPPAIGDPLNLHWDNYLSLIGHPNLTLARGARPAFNASGIDLWAAGPLDQHWSGAFNPTFDADNSGSSVSLAYGQYSTTSPSTVFTARAGQLQPFAVEFNQGGPSMALSTPLIFTTTPDTGTTWTPGTPLRGVELGAVNLSHLNAYLGAGQPNLGAGVAANTDLYASAEYLLGESGNSLTAYGYWGTAALPPAAINARDHRIGGFANFYLEKAKVVAGYLQGSDDTATGTALHNHGCFLLGELPLSERWSVYARYDRMKSELSPGNPIGSSQTQEGPALGVTWWAQSQVVLTSEGQLLSITGQRQSRMLTTQLLWAF